MRSATKAASFAPRCPTPARLLDGRAACLADRLRPYSDNDEGRAAETLLLSQVLLERARSDALSQRSDLGATADLSTPLRMHALDA